MNINDRLLAVLACPETGQALEIKDQQLATQDSSRHYPIIKEIPWLFRNPLHSMVDWSIKLNHFNQVLNDEIRQLKNEIKRAPKLTRPRLALLLQGKQSFQQTVSELVSPILSAKVASKPVYDALSDRAPHTQNLLSYEANLYRDWVWGDEENKISAQIVLNKIQSEKVNNLLVVGAGSCRLAYDLHQALNPALTVANDINPLLLFATNEIISGRGLNIYEFPAHPKTAESVAVSHQIAGLTDWPENFHLLFSDAAIPAMQPAAFDLLVTPWVIDIQPFELVTFMKCLNHYLPIGGEWVNFGSLVFSQNRDAQCYAIGEIEALAEQAGFKIESLSQDELPYLKSPYNAGYRMENVSSWRAIKVKDMAHSNHLQNLPDWILDIDKAVPATKEIQTFAFSHQMYAELAAKIDGRKSIKQIASRIAQEKSMDKQEAINMVKNFYLKIIQQTI